MIKFLCPNGHPLSAPENLVGKPGKCPKCQSAFIVPEPAPDEPEDTSVDVASPAAPAASAPAAAPEAPGAGPSDTAVGNAGSASSGSEVGSAASGGSKPGASGKGGVSDKASASGKTKPLPAGHFVFLCPNGHRLNGPPTLKGKPGQCPHCGARFLIPADDEDELAEGQPVEDELPAGQPVEEEIPAGVPEEEPPPIEAEAYDPPVEPVPPGLHALCYILGRLWDRKTADQQLELYTTEGDILSPEHYSEILSTADYAVFAFREGESHTISVLPWSAIRKIVVKQVKTISLNVFR